MVFTGAEGRALKEGASVPFLEDLVSSRQGRIEGTAGSGLAKIFASKVVNKCPPPRKSSECVQKNSRALNTETGT